MNMKWRNAQFYFRAPENIPEDQGRSNVREWDQRKQLNKRQCEKSMMGHQKEKNGEGRTGMKCEDLEKRNRWLFALEGMWDPLLC